jgi:hypothetical protein
MEYLDFELEITPGSGSGYAITVIHSPAGEAHASLHLPFDDQALATQLATLQQASTSSDEMGSQAFATGEQTMQSFGQALFEALFAGQVRDLYVASRAAAESQGKGLRLKLRLEPPELAVLPWELLYDAGQEQYLCLSDTTPLVRYVELPAPCQPLTVTLPLCILGMTASPKDLPELDVAREQQRIDTALAGLKARGLAQVTWLSGHSWQDLQQALLAGSWHIFHFIGHGGFDLRSNEGVIVLEDSAGAAYSLSATQLGMLLADHHALRLVVLNACEGAQGSTHDIFASTAATLVRRGIPAVLAMRGAITDEAALALSRTFYVALAAGMPVDTAVSEARKAIRLGGVHTFEWSTPVLHLHAPDGILFHLGQLPSINRGATAASTREAASGAAVSTPARTAVIPSTQAAPFAMQEPLAASLVRIRTFDGRVVGAGFLVGERQILTCAHVISQALGLADAPVDLPQAAVSLDFPFVSPHTLFTAKVVLWCPPLADGSDDIAGLELQGEPPAGVEAVRFSEAADVWEHPFRALGFPAGYDDGVWATGRLLGRQATDWVMIEDVKTQGFAVGPGFSGTPVWDTQLAGVVGMVVAASRPADTKAAFVIPLDVLVAAWPRITVPQREPRNPYKGLRPFTQQDAGDFFGREPVVEKLVEIVKSFVTGQTARTTTRLLTIIGPSGSGKSSVVMAGLLPRLQSGALPGSKDWVYLDPLVPGKHPLEALASTLKPHFPDTSFKTLREDLEDDAARGLHLLATQLAKQREASVVLLVDQGEELFTQTESEDEWQRFIRLLLTASSEPRGPLVVLLTLRADFYDRPMQYPALFNLIDTQHFALLSMEPDNLRRVIEQPAALPDVQMTFEGDLVNRLLFEVQGQVGALPLLQFTLDQLFQKRSGRQLTLSAYRELGGVKGALTRQAEETYAALSSEEHRKLARALFVRLIDPGATEQDTTRRRAALTEFTLDDATQTRLMRETIDSFIAARLLTTNEVAGTTTIEVSHEAVIREWKRLADWLREARQDIPLQQAISEDVAEWERRGKPRDRLYRGSQLKEAQAWATRNMLSSNEVAFLRAGVAYRVRFVVSIIAIVLLLVSTAGVAGWVVLHQPPDPTLVTNLHDDGWGSLRWDIANARSGSKITFDARLRKGTILLTTGDITINKKLTIYYPWAQQLTISSRNNSDISISREASVDITGLSFTNSTFTPTKSFIINEGMLTLINSTVSGNSIKGGGGAGNGGGIFSDGVLTLINSTVSGNSALGSGGGIFSGGMLTLINSTVSGNSAGFDGGGIANYGTLTVTNSTIANNTAFHVGGGILNWGGKARITFCTIAHNRSSSLGGGVYVGDKDEGNGIVLNSQTIIADSLIATNQATSGGADLTGYHIAGILIMDGYNLIQDSNILSPPWLSLPSDTSHLVAVDKHADVEIDQQLGKHGGATETLALLSSSPAIDAIPLQYCQVQVIFNQQSRMYTDQRGMKRPDGSEQMCDIGAYEYVDPST